MRRDLLHEIFMQQLSRDDAEKLVSEILASPEAPRLADELGMSGKEYTAYMHGAPFDVIARWRYDGWPAVCTRCNGSLNSDAYGWMVSEGRDGRCGLVHVICPGLQQG
jgi:hypothetical protein